jgi:hypothetical protein
MVVAEELIEARAGVTYRVHPGPARRRVDAATTLARSPPLRQGEDLYGRVLPKM